MTFPSSPSNGDTHLENGVSYTYNSTYSSWLMNGRIVVTAKANNVGIGSTWGTKCEAIDEFCYAGGDVQSALAIALVEIENLKARVTTLEG